MLSAAEIKNIKFSTAMSGYKKDEVDVFLDKVEADYTQFDRIIKDFQSKIESLNKEIEEYKESQNSIQSVLLSAQRLADKIVGEAKEKSEEIIQNAESSISVITAREKELSTTFEIKAQDRKNALEKELATMISDAEKKAAAITKAADDSVKRQQILFDKLKLEIAAFKTNITSKYKEHLEILNSIPDTVPQDPNYLAEVVSTTIEKEPDVMEFVSSTTPKTAPQFTEDLSSKSSNGFAVENSELNEKEE